MATQVLPSDDGFERGSDVPGTYLCMYLGCRVTTTAAGAPAAWAIRLLHSGYQAIGGDGVNLTPAAFLGATETVANQLRPGAMLYRALPSLSDCTVSGTFRQYANAGSPRFDLVSPTGVLARVQAGTLYGDGAITVRYQNPDCYAAYYRANTVQAKMEFTLARVNAGAFTTLAIASRSQTEFDAAALAKSGVVALAVTNTSGDVQLSATFTGLGMGSPIVLSALDTGASVLTSAGRPGFSCGRDRKTSDSLNRVADLVEEFSVLSGATVLLADRFMRTGLSGAYNFSTDATYSDSEGNNGRSLQMAYSWDQFAGGDENPLLEQNGAGDFAQWTGDAADSNAVLVAIASRPATNSRSQRRSVSIVMPSQPSVGQQGAGIMLRASEPEPVAGTYVLGIGYLASVTWVSGATTTPTFTLSRQRLVGGVSVVETMASLADVGDAYTNGFAAAWTLDFEVYNRQGSTSNGPTICKVRVNLGAGDVQVPLVASGLSGVTADGDGTVTDESTQRLTSGPGEGIVFINSAGETTTIKYDSWAEGSLTNADLADRDQASVTVATEGSVTGVDLSSVLGVDYPLRLERHHFSIYHKFDSGHRRGNPRFTDSTGNAIGRTHYQCAVSGVPTATLSTFLDYWEDHKGSETAFYWTAPGASAALKCHFVEDSLRYELMAVGTYALSFLIEELL